MKYALEIRPAIITKKTPGSDPFIKVGDIIWTIYTRPAGIIGWFYKWEHRYSGSSIEDCQNKVKAIVESNEATKKLKAVIYTILLLISLGAKAQHWPGLDSTCTDRPYTIGGDNVIHHTCQIDHGSQVRGDLSYTGLTWIKADTTAIATKTYTISKSWEQLHIPGWDSTYYCTETFGANTKKSHYVGHPDSLYCPMCEEIKPYRHVLIRREFGYLSKSVDIHQISDITPLGLFMRKTYKSVLSFKLEEIKPYKKYLPKGFLSSPEIQRKWINLLNQYP